MKNRDRDRDRAWRRYIEDIHVIRRLKMFSSSRYHMQRDANDIQVSESCIKNYIGTQTNFISKTLSTTKHGTKYKFKYSPNRSKGCWRDTAKSREYDKKFFLKILKENEII
jgi:hypothetical protein